PGDRDRVRLADQSGEHLGPAHDLDAHRPGGVELGRLLDRPAVDEQVLAQDVLGIVPHAHPDARLLELLCGLGLPGVASADVVAARKKDAGQRRHAGAAGPHQMNPQFPTTSRSTARTRCAASRRPIAADALAIPRSRSVSRLSIVRTRLSAVRSRSAIRTAAPAVTIAAAFSSWCPPPKVPGTRIIGRPTAAASETVLTPARLTTTSARAMSAAMSAA